MIYEFRYTYHAEIDINKNIYSTYVILETASGRLWLNSYNDGKITRIEITDVSDNICHMLKNSDISSWNMKYFEPIMEFFTGFEWSLDIVADDLSVHCYGRNNYPSGLRELKSILKYIGVY